MSGFGTAPSDFGDFVFGESPFPDTVNTVNMSVGPALSTGAIGVISFVNVTPQPCKRMFGGTIIPLIVGNQFLQNGNST